MVTITIVPGSFILPRAYNVLTDKLSQHGLQSVIVDLPSVGRREEQPKNMTDDATEISRVVSALADEGKEVLLMTHSYSGIPGTQSLEKLSCKARRFEGKPGGVRKIVYLASVVTKVGFCGFDFFGPAIHEIIKVEHDYMTIDPAITAPMAFSDVPLEKGLKYCREDMAVHSTPSFREHLRYAGYNDVEVHYIVCEEDKTIPAEYQYKMIEVVKKSSGRDVHVHKLRSGHSPNASQPDKLAGILKSIVGDY